MKTIIILHILPSYLTLARSSLAKNMYEASAPNYSDSGSGSDDGSGTRECDRESKNECDRHRYLRS